MADEIGSDELRTKAGDALLRGIIKSTMERRSPADLRLLAEAYALVVAPARSGVDGV